LALDDSEHGGEKRQLVLLDDLFISPALSEQHVAPLSLIQQEGDSLGLQGMKSIAELLEQHPLSFVLGDPGAGKSTLINWLMMGFTASGSNQLIHKMGSLVPFAFILRDLDLRVVTDWDSLWQAFEHSNGELLGRIQGETEGLMATLQASGQVLFLFDGLV